MANNSSKMTIFIMTTKEAVERDDGKKKMQFTKQSIIIHERTSICQKAFYLVQDFVQLIVRFTRIYIHLDHFFEIYLVSHRNELCECFSQKHLAPFFVIYRFQFVQPISDHFH
jgi:hypothetical protein